jgi:hypothetical protein
LTDLLADQQLNEYAVPGCAGTGIILDNHPVETVYEQVMQ